MHYGYDFFLSLKVSTKIAIPLHVPLDLLILYNNKTTLNLLYLFIDDFVFHNSNYFILKLH